jgi:hypothetical protein
MVNYKVLVTLSSLNNKAQFLRATHVHISDTHKNFNLLKFAQVGSLL